MLKITSPERPSLIAWQRKDPTSLILHPLTQIYLAWQHYHCLKLHYNFFYYLLPIFPIQGLNTVKVYSLLRCKSSWVFLVRWPNQQAGTFNLGVLLFPRTLESSTGSLASDQKRRNKESREYYSEGFQGQVWKSLLPTFLSSELTWPYLTLRKPGKAVYLIPEGQGGGVWWIHSIVGM